jgi:hypothetical protein
MGIYTSSLRSENVRAKGVVGRYVRLYPTPSVTYRADYDLSIHPSIYIVISRIPIQDDIMAPRSTCPFSKNIYITRPKRRLSRVMLRYGLTDGRDLFRVKRRKEIQLLLLVVVP